MIDMLLTSSVLIVLLLGLRWALRRGFLGGSSMPYGSWRRCAC